MSRKYRQFLHSATKLKSSELYRNDDMARFVDTDPNYEIEIIDHEMNSILDTGNFRERRNELLVVEWKIDDFLQTTDRFEYSPTFYFSSSTWCLHLCTCDEDKEWLSLHLCCNSSREYLPIMEFALGMKKPDGTPSFQQTFIRKFEEDEKFGINFFAIRSIRVEQETGMITSDPLTIVCKLRNIISPCENNAGFFPGLLGLLSSKKHSDVTIKVKDQEFQAHKVILVASSKVFSAMFGHDMSENNSGVLNIEDCEPESFKDFLNFLYSGATNITDSNVYNLYSIGQKYCVESLIPFCVGYMILHLSVDTVCQVANLGHLYSDNDITFACTRFFEKNVRSVLVTSQWKFLMKVNYLAAFKLLEYIAPRIEVKE